MMIDDLEREIPRNPWAEIEGEMARSERLAEERHNNTQGELDAMSRRLDELSEQVASLTVSASVASRRASWASGVLVSVGVILLLKMIF
jgi:hypothetical protein